MTQPDYTRYPLAKRSGITVLRVRSFGIFLDSLRTTFQKCNDFKEKSSSCFKVTFKIHHIVWPRRPWIRLSGRYVVVTEVRSLPVHVLERFSLVIQKSLVNHALFCRISIEFCPHSITTWLTSQNCESSQLTVLHLVSFCDSKNLNKLSHSIAHDRSMVQLRLRGRLVPWTLTVIVELWSIG